MAGKQEVVTQQHERFDPSTLWNRTLQVARQYKIANIEFLNAIYQVADTGELVDAADSADMAFHVNSRLGEAIKQKKLLVIDDNTNARVIGFDPLGNNKVQMITIHRFGGKNETTQIIVDPHLEVGFEDGQFTLGVHGVIRNGNGNGFDTIVREITKISPNGNNNPPSFFIATADNLLFGKIDVTNSFSCARAYMG